MSSHNKRGKRKDGNKKEKMVKSGMKQDDDGERDVIKYVILC